jgi:hypothetical protein
MRNHGCIPKKESLEIHAQVPQMQPCRVLGTVNFPATSLMFPGLLVSFHLAREASAHTNNAHDANANNAAV